MAERSKALRSDRSPVHWAWVQIPILTEFIFYSGFNTDYGSSEPLKTLVVLCYVIYIYIYIRIYNICIYMYNCI